MDVEKLVQTIVNKVLMQLNNEDKQDRIMILGDRDEVKNEPVLKYFGDNVKISYVGNESVQDKPLRYILPFLSCSGMAALATGRAFDLLSEKILELLLSGRCVEVFEFEYKSFNQTAPDALYKLYESYEESLAAFGLKSVEVENNDTMRLRKKVVTEKDVMQARENGVAVLRVPSDASITALAVESAAGYKIQLLKG